MTKHSVREAEGVIVHGEDPELAEDEMLLALHNTPARWVLLVDGECTLCSHFGITVNRFDDSDKIKYCTQQSPTGIALGTACGAAHMLGKSVLLLDTKNCHAFVKSEAVLETSMLLDRTWIRLLARVGRLFPLCLRDTVYDFVSCRRHAWFGTVACKRPPAKYKLCVLD